MTADCRELERQEATIDGVSALWTVASYTVTVQSPVTGPYTNGRQLQELAYFFRKGKEGYILDFTATAGNFPMLRSAHEYIGRSFEFDEQSLFSPGPPLAILALNPQLVGCASPSASRRRLLPSQR